MPSTTPWGAYATPRCGAPESPNSTSLAPDDSPGEMRYDRDGKNNVCFASCAEGYTAHRSSQDVQTFTCNADGTFSGSLHCSVVKCPPEPLEAISPMSTESCAGCDKFGAHANRSTWTRCSREMANQFNHTCHVKCSTGFTNSYVGGNATPTSKVKPYKCVAIRDGVLGSGDPKFQTQGVWTYDGAQPAADNKSPFNLQCKAVQCDRLTRPRNTVYSEDDHTQGKAESEYRDETALRDEALKVRCFSAGNMDNNDIRYFQDSCQMECLEGWYPADDPAWQPRRNAHVSWDESGFYPELRNTTVVYTCAEPGRVPADARDETGRPCPLPGSKRGVWCPGPCCTGFINQNRTLNEPLFCEEGTLDPTQTRVNLSHIDAAADRQLDWPPDGASSNSISDPNGPGLDKEGPDGTKVTPSPFLGWRFGGSRAGANSRGPQYKFIIEVRDTYGRPRNYNNLARKKGLPKEDRGRSSPDFVLVYIERVPLDHLKKKDRDLQPTESWDNYAYPSQPAQGSDVRPYQGQKKQGDKYFDSSSQPKVIKLSNTDAKRKGQWEFHHQFSEHGVFFLSVYVCPTDNQDPCFQRSADHLVPGTGLTRTPYDDDTGRRKSGPEWKCSVRPDRRGLSCPKAMDNNVTGNTSPSDTETSQVPASAFTVCPQGTKAPNPPPNGFVLGSRLAECIAQQGFFGPEGPGHIAEKCDSRGFFCEFEGMTWPVAKPGYWVSGNDPSEVRKCQTLGACPGSMLYGVGSENWQKYGDIGTVDHPKGFPQDACLIETPDDPDKHNAFMNRSDDAHLLRFSCDSPDTPNAACVDTQKILKRTPLAACFTTTQYIKRGVNEGGVHVLYELEQSLTITANASRCRDAVGSRCCPGNRGEGCQSCCLQENLGVAKAKAGTLQNARSCDHRQWHAVDGGGAGSCFPCPENKMGVFFYIMTIICMLLFAPVVAKVSAIAKHAGAAQGPVLSVLNFFQSSDLFQSLDLKWPAEFRWFCSAVASLFNFNLSALLRRLNFMIPQYLREIIPRIPAPECAFHLKYEIRWLLSVASPLFIAAAIAMLIPLSALVRPVATSRRARGLISWGGWLVLSAMAGSMLGNSMQVWHGTWHGNHRFDPSNDKPIGAKLGATFGVVFLCSQRWVRQQISRFRYCERCDPARNVKQESSNEDSQSEAEKRVTSQRLRSRNGRKARCCEHNYQQSCQKVARGVCVYLMVGYVFLAKTALEPLSCKVQLNGRRYITATAGSDIECSFCWVPADNTRLLSYRQLASLAIVAYTVYGLGTPLLFTIILWTNRKVLYKAKFMQSFGFLSSKMREEWYIWEVFISVRKLLLVTMVMWSPGQELAMTLINLFITVGAFGAQCKIFLTSLSRCNTCGQVIVSFDIYTHECTNPYLAAIDRLEATVCECRCQCNGVCDAAMHPLGANSGPWRWYQ